MRFDQIFLVAWHFFGNRLVILLELYLQIFNGHEGLKTRYIDETATAVGIKSKSCILET